MAEYYYNNFDEDITNILIDAWDECCNDIESEDYEEATQEITVDILYLMCCGYSEEDVVNYASKHGINITCTTTDPLNWPNPAEALILTALKIKDLKKSQNKK